MNTSKTTSEYILVFVSPLPTGMLQACYPDALN